MTADLVIQWRRRRRIRIAAVLCIVVTLSALDHSGALGRRTSRAKDYDGRVARVVFAADGDTVDIGIPDAGRATTRVRLKGLDCPEIAHGPGGTDAYFGREAAEFVRSEIVGRQVRVVLDPHRESRDRYGRLLAYLYLVGGEQPPVADGSASDEVLLNRLLIERGLAYADRRFEHLRNQEFVAAEKRAMKARVGLWAGVSREQMPTWRQSVAD